MARRKAHKHHHMFEITAIAGGFMVLVIVALGIKFSGSGLTAAVVHSDLIAYTNTERVDNNLSALVENALLDKAAQAKANDMASKGYFSHTEPNGQAPWHWFIEADYDYRYAGENLAVRFSDSKEVVDAWMASPTHRANIVKEKYTEMGIGIANGMYQGQPVTFVVQFFGTPKAAVAPTPEPTVVAVAEKPAAQPTVAKSAPAVAGAETAAPVTQPVPTPVAKASIFTRIVSFFNGALHSLTASVANSQGVLIGEGASTEQ